VSRTALVTGATGGLGRALVPLLLGQGYAVTATGRAAEAGAALTAAGARFVPADLVTDDLAPLLEGADTIFHLAARSSPWGRRRDFEAINIDATTRLLAAARAAGCARFVHASTPSIYAEPRARMGLTEASPPARRFANHYAVTKYEGERRVLAADCAAMRTIVLRPRAIVGPDDSVLLPRLLRLARAGRVPLPGGGKALVELTDVRDVAAAFAAAAEAAQGQAVNISGGAPRPVRHIVETICATLGLSPSLPSVPTGLALLAGRAAEALGALTGKEPPVTHYSVMALAFSQTFDLTAARAVLGWEPRHSPEAAIAFALAGQSR
jgi:nucleoside-diphosphate-sugar epimerase